MSSVPAATIEPDADVRAVQQNRAHADEALILDRAAVDDRAVPDRHVVADRRRVRAVHDVHDRAVLDVRPPADADSVHVASDDGAHPDAALLADLDVANHLCAGVDESRRMNARKLTAIRPKHWMIILAGHPTRRAARRSDRFARPRGRARRQKGARYRQ